MHGTRTLSIIIALLVADRRRQLNMLNGRSLPPRVQTVGLILIAVCLVLAGALVFTVSTQIGKIYPLNSSAQPAFLVVSWLIWVILLVAFAGSIDPEAARAVNEPFDAAVLSSYGILRRHLLWSRFLIPTITKVLGIILFFYVALGPWLVSSPAGRAVFPTIFAVLLATVVTGSCCGMVVTLLLVRWGRAATVSVRFMIMVPLVAFICGSWLGPGIKQFSEAKNLVESGYTVLAEFIISSQPSWWEELYKVPSEIVVACCLAFSGFSLLLLGGVASSLLSGSEAQAGFKAPRNLHVSLRISLAISNIFRSIALQQSMAFRVFSSLFIKDIFACFRQDRLALRKAYLVFLAGLALLGAGIGTSLVLEGRAVMDAPLAVSFGLITAFIILAADGSVQIASIEAERNNWQTLRLLPLTISQLRIMKICSFATVTGIISMPGVIGIALLTSSQIWLLLATSTSISLMAGLSSILTQMLSPLAETVSMRIIERSQLADLVQPILISFGAYIVVSGVMLTPSPTLKVFLATFPLVLVSVFIISLLLPTHKEVTKCLV